MDLSVACFSPLYKLKLLKALFANLVDGALCWVRRYLFVTITPHLCMHPGKPLRCLPVTIG